MEELAMAALLGVSVEDVEIADLKRRSGITLDEAYQKVDDCPAMREYRAYMAKRGLSWTTGRKVKRAA